MPDIEKVMRGLEAHANPQACETCAGEECPYYNMGGGFTGVTCSSILAADALALLKGQEPRVMTWGKVLEFIELPNEGFSEKTPCYVEVYEPDPDKIKWVDAETLHGWMRNCEMRERRRLLYNRIGRHGWRLWTSRPSPEQMRETKWEEDINGD